MTFTRIDENTREFVEDKFNYRVVRRSEVDLWDIKPASGILPVYLQGSYTTAEHAKNRIVDYIASKKKD